MAGGLRIWRLVFGYSTRYLAVLAVLALCSHAAGGESMDNYTMPNFWARPLAMASACFTETLECRAADKGLPRWEAAPPLVVLMARSANLQSFNSAAAFLRGCLTPAKTGTHTGLSAAPLAAWQVGNMFVSTPSTLWV